MKDINDDEIRIISSDNPKPAEKVRKRRIEWWIYLTVIIFALCGIIACFLYFTSTTDEDKTDQIFELKKGIFETDSREETLQGFCTVRDTIVDDVRLTIIIPNNAIPTLQVGGDIEADKSVVLAMQAADIREDNGGIVGSFVVDGNLISKGEAKAGFCSIINNEISIGVADATPMFEQALTANGYFFRQYPLVVGGQTVENKPKGASIRKALADWDGRVCVILSHDRVSFHDFSEALVDLGVRNAIYLVGGMGYGIYVDENGERYSVGKPWDKEFENINYIVWR